MWHVEQLRPSMVAKQIVHDWASNELPHYAEPARCALRSVWVTGIRRAMRGIPQGRRGT